MVYHLPISVLFVSMHKRSVFTNGHKLRQQKDIFIHSYSVLQTVKACYIMVSYYANLGQIKSHPPGTLTHTHSKNL